MAYPESEVIAGGRNETFTPAEFAKKFNWKNDPSKARFLKLDDEK